MKYYIFSLGNPGERYIHTRHNAGRIVADAIDFVQLEGKAGNRLEYFVPNTYMNESGIYIAKKMRQAKDGTVFIIIYDDKDIPLGEMKVSYNRSSGGHNGVESIIEHLGTKEFYRIRIGIGEKPNKDLLLHEYVLSYLTQEEKKILEDTVARKVEQAIIDITAGKYENKKLDQPK